MKPGYIILLIVFSFIGWMLGAYVQIRPAQTQATMLAWPTAAPTPTVNQGQVMFVLVNEVREKEDLLPLAYNKPLADSAVAKACDMRDKHYFSHYAPDGSAPWHFFKEAHYSYLYAGENLIEGLPDAKDAMLLLLASDTHRANILATRFQEIGIGTCGEYTVQHFGAL